MYAGGGWSIFGGKRLTAVLKLGFFGLVNILPVEGLCPSLSPYQLDTAGERLLTNRPASSSSILNKRMHSPTCSMLEREFVCDTHYSPDALVVVRLLLQ